MNHNITKEKKNIVADPIFEAIKGKRVNLSTVKSDYYDVLIVNSDLFTVLVEIEGKHFLVGKSSIVDIELPEDVVDNVLSSIDEAFKLIEIKKEAIKSKKNDKPSFKTGKYQPDTEIKFKRKFPRQ